MPSDLSTRGARRPSTARPSATRAAARTRLRWWAWRSRHLLAALCVGLAAAVVVGELRPAPPPQRRVVVLAGDVAAGEPFDGHLSLAHVPLAGVPDGALTDLASAHGPASIALPAGTVLVPGMVASSDAARAAPPGTVLTPVRLADDAVLGLLGPGQRVDLVLVPEPWSDGGPPDPGADAVVLARDALVLPYAPPESSDRGGLLGGGSEPAAPVILVAVTPAEARAITSMARSGHVGAVLRAANVE